MGMYHQPMDVRMGMDWPLAYTVSFVRSLAVVIVKPPLHYQLLFVSMEISPFPIPTKKKMIRFDRNSKQ